MHSRQSRALCLVLFTALSASTQMGCALLKPQSPVKEPVPANLMQPCPPLSEPKSGKGSDLLPWAVTTALTYRECAAGKLLLIEAVGAQGKDHADD